MSIKINEIKEEARYYRYFEEAVNPIVKQLEHALMIERPPNIE